MTPAAIVLTFFLCASDADEQCIDGEIRTTSCARAEAYLRAGMTAGQVLHILSCEAER